MARPPLDADDMPPEELESVLEEVCAAEIGVPTMAVGIVPADADSINRLREDVCACVLMVASCVLDCDERTVEDCWALVLGSGLAVMVCCRAVRSSEDCIVGCAALVANPAVEPVKLGGIVMKTTDTMVAVPPLLLLPSLRADS